MNMKVFNEYVALTAELGSEKKAFIALLEQHANKDKDYFDYFLAILAFNQLGDAE